MNNNMEKNIYEISLDDIIPNRFQPRLTFDEEAMKELTASIKEHGVIQPLVLRRLGDKYEIIAGERRYKASTLAGLDKVPAIIMNLDDNASAEVALVENIQRKQLTPIEEAKSYQQLLDRGYVTQEDLAKRLGKSQPGISNKMRLLNLSDEVQEALLANKISERHARSLLSIKNEDQQVKMLNRIINERMTVRQADSEIKKMIENNPDASNEEGVDKVIDNNSNNIDNQFMNNDIPQFNMDPITPIQPVENISSMNNNSFINLNQPNDTIDDIPQFNQQQSILMGGQQSIPNNNPNMPNIPNQPSETTFNPFMSNVNNNFTTQQPMYEPEELNMDEDFKEIDEPTQNKVSDIDKLLQPQSTMPEFVPPFTQPLTNEKRDLRPILDDIRQTVNSIQREGFVVDLDEFDYENTYQVVIKIHKNNL